MNANFKIIDNIAIEDHINYFDLHNNFDLKKIEIKSTEIVLFFEKIDRDSDKDEIYNILKLSHENIDSYTIESEREIKSEDRALMNLSFSPRGDFDINTIFLKNTPEEGDEIVYVFEDDYYIRISCDTITLSYFDL